jgi:dihydroxyacetone kinase
LRRREKARKYHVELETLELRELFAATQLAFAAPIPDAAANATMAPIVVNVEDGTGTVVTTDNSAVTLAIGTGPGGANLAGTLTVNAVNGVATFTGLSLDTAGDFTLTASDGLLTPATSSSFTITPAAGTATKLVFETPPADAAVNSSLTTFKVDVTDSTGTVVTSDNSAVTIAIATGPLGSNLVGTATVNAVNGVATFSGLSLDTVGAYTLTASDGALTSVTAPSFNITAAAGPAAKLVFDTAPAGGAVNTSLAPIVVNVTDSSGTLVTTDNSAVTIAIATGPVGSQLIGTATVNAVNGVATFTGLKLDTIGAYTLTATDGALTSVTSPSFNISAAGNPHATSLSFGTQPTDDASGSTLTTPVVVNVLDQFGAVLPTSKGTVKLSVLSGPNGGKLKGKTSIRIVNGAATFNNLKLTVGGTYTLRAKSGRLTASSASFTVSAPSVATSLAFLQQPTDTVVGSRITPPVSVQVLDQYGQLLTTDHSTVKMTVVGHPEVKGVSAHVKNGVAVFTKLTPTVAGTFALHAADKALTAVDSDTFTVSAAAASKIVFSSVPVNGDAAGPVTIIASVEDRFGNVVTTDTSNITLTSKKAPTGLTPINVTVAAVAGVATFPAVALTAPGKYQLTITDGLLKPVTSKQFKLV